MGTSLSWLLMCLWTCALISWRPMGQKPLSPDAPWASDPPLYYALWARATEATCLSPYGPATPPPYAMQGGDATFLTAYGPEVSLSLRLMDHGNPLLVFYGPCVILSWCPRRPSPGKMLARDAPSYNEIDLGRQSFDIWWFRGALSWRPKGHGALSWHPICQECPCPRASFSSRPLNLRLPFTSYHTSYALITLTKYSDYVSFKMEANNVDYIFQISNLRNETKA